MRDLDVADAPERVGRAVDGLRPEDREGCALPERAVAQVVADARARAVDGDRAASVLVDRRDRLRSAVTRRAGCRGPPGGYPGRRHRRGGPHLAGQGRGLVPAPVAEIRLGGPQVVPVGLGLDADALDGDGCPLDVEQALDHVLGPLVATLAEVLVADDAVRVDEVERRPVVVGEGGPDRVVVVGRDRVVDLPLPDRLPNEVHVVLERELGCMDPDHEQPVVPVGPRPRTDVRLLAQPVDAGERPEVHEHHMPPQLGGAEWLGVEPPGGPVEGGDVHTGEDSHQVLLTKRPLRSWSARAWTAGSPKRRAHKSSQSSLSKKNFQSLITPCLTNRNGTGDWNGRKLELRSKAPGTNG